MIPPTRHPFHRARPLLAAALLAGLGGSALAQEAPSSDATTRAPSAVDARKTPPSALERVEVTGRRNDTEERRLSTAAKIVVGREEIEQFGDMTLADVMKRLPSVTIGGRPGRGGQIRMRGMGNGYTQILVDGERVPRGFSIDQISPDLVERIEIYRAPTAETGTRAIAGTINIVLREPLRRSGDDLRLGATEERGRVQPNVSWTRNDVIGENGTYNLTVSGLRSIPRTDTMTRTTFTDLATGVPERVQDLHQIQHDTRYALHVTSRLQWNLGRGDQLTLQPFLSVAQGRTDTTGTLDQPVTPFAMSAPYATSVSNGSSRSTLARFVALLKKHIDDTTRVETRASVGTFRSRADSVVDEFDDVGTPVLDQRSTTSIRDRSWTLSGKLFHTIGDRHSLVGGLEAEGVNRDENALTTINGAPSLPGFAGDIDASTLRLAAYAQDDWTPSKAFAANAGLRWESIRTKSDASLAGFGGPVRNTSDVVSPLFHAVWRFDEPARDQVRFSLTRSDRPPSLQNLISVPTLSTLYPAPGPNVASSPDRAGNANLRPELAKGIDLAIEHYMGTTGVVSLSVFRRDIDHLIRNITSLESVPWATVPRWVVRPRNIGDATTHGIEFDTKFALDELIAGAPAINVRANVSVYGSHVEGVPGPYNRIDQQPRASANLGADWRVRGLPLTVGGNVNWVPPYSVQETDIQTQVYQLSRVVDAYALWTITPKAKLRFSFSNLVPRNYVTTSSIVDGGQAQTVVSNGPTYRVTGLRLELKL